MAQDFPPITTLIPTLRAGDEASWTTLVELFSPGLQAKAHVLFRNSKLRGKLTPDDLLSETYAKAWKHHQLIRGQSTFQVAKWLLTIMTNSFLDQYRKHDLPEETQPDWGLPADLSASPTNRIESLEDEAKLHAILAELDVDDRRVLLLKFWHDQTHQQIADEVGVSKAAVTRRLQKLLPQLQVAMQSGGVGE